MICHECNKGFLFDILRSYADRYNDVTKPVLICSNVRCDFVIPILTSVTINGRVLVCTGLGCDFVRYED